MEALFRHLANLCTVKSLVTLTLTLLFAVLSIRSLVSPEQFMTVFTVVIAFYFGTQAERRRKDGEEP